MSARSLPTPEPRQVVLTAKISIALATYNGEAHLFEQLTSLSAQTIPPYEVVITDDASTDGTLGIIERFSREAPFPVRYERNDRQLGYADNFLRALSLCTGDFIAFCDQDDVWAPNKLAAIANEFKRSDCDLVVHVAAVVDDSLVPNGLQHPPIRRRRILAGTHYNPWLIVPGMAMAARRSFLDMFDHRVRPNTRLVDGESMKHDEWVYFLGTALGKVAMISESLVRYRQHGMNACGPPAALSNVAALRLARIAGQSVYKMLSRRAGDYATFLSSLLIQEEPYRSRCFQAQAYYRILSERLQIIAQLYDRDAAFASRAKSFGALLKSRSYRLNVAGTLSFRSLIKDTLRTIGLLRIA